MKILSNTHRYSLIAILLGVALVGAFAPFGIYPLAIIAPMGLLALILNANPKRAAWLGFLFGLGLFGAGVYWIYISIHDYGNVPFYLSGLLTVGLVMVLALFPMTTCYLTARYFPNTTSAKMILAFPALWLSIEWFRSWVGCGFPWLFLGYSQTNSVLKGYAPILSVYGVSLAVLMSSGLLLQAILKFRQKDFRSMLFSVGGCITIWIIGAGLSIIPWTTPTGKPLTISLVQGNIPQSLKWSPEHLRLSFDRYTELTEPLWGKSDIVVWPEAAIPMVLQDAEDFINGMDAQAQKHHTYLILGIPVQDPKGNGYYNAVVSLGENRSAYLKRNLVPFGEYVPFQEYLTRVFDFMHVPLPDIKAGHPGQPFMQVNGMKINTSICFEITFPELVAMRDPDVGLLLTVTNDAWFGKSIAQAQHLQMGMMRSIELGRPLLFASNDGITALISATGEIEKQAPAHEPFVLTGSVQAMSGVTPWMTNGMDPILVIIFCFLVAAKRTDVEKKRDYDGRTIQLSRN